MTKAPEKQRKRVIHCPMPEDPREIARAMFKAADRKIEKEGRQ